MDKVPKIGLSRDVCNILKCAIYFQALWFMAVVESTEHEICHLNHCKNVKFRTLSAFIRAVIGERNVPHKSWICLLQSRWPDQPQFMGELSPRSSPVNRSFLSGIHLPIYFQNYVYGSVCMWMWDLWGPESWDPPGIRIKGGCEEPNLDAGRQTLQEQSMLLPAKPSLQLLFPRYPSLSVSLNSAIFKSRNTQTCVPFAVPPDLF